MFGGRTLRKLFPALSEIAATLRFHTYLEDGLITRHVADFLNDPGFSAAYSKGKATGSWGNMNPRWRVYTACWAAAHAMKLSGDFVECGVNRGGMSLTIIEYLNFHQSLNFNASGKRFFLLDTYSGFAANTQPSPANRGQYSDCYNDVLKTFAPYAGVRIVRGIIPETLALVDAETISYLSIDLNCAEPEIDALRYFWPRLSGGAMILLDDYAGGSAYRPQKEAFDQLSSTLGFSILSLPTGQGLIVKP